MANKLVWTIFCLLLATATAGLSGAAMLASSDDAQHWATVLAIGSGIVIFLAAVFGWLFKMGERVVVAGLRRGLADNEVKADIQAIVAPIIAAHNEMPDAHFKQAFTSRQQGFEKIAEMFQKHNNDPLAHREALREHPTRAELNGVVQRLASEIRYMRKDLRRLDPTKFQDDDSFDPDITGGRLP